MSQEVKDLFDMIEVAANSATLFIFFKDAKVRFPGKTVKNALSNQQSLEDILSHLFIRKQVMRVKYSDESESWCVNSLNDLCQECDKYAGAFYQKSMAGDENHLFATILREWGNECLNASKEIQKIPLTKRTLKSILKSFRLNTYPIIMLLIHALNDNSRIKIQAQQEFQDGLKNSGLDLKQLSKRFSIEVN